MGANSHDLPQKNNMPAKIQVACRVSSKCSKHSALISDGGGKRRKRNKIDGVVMRSMEGRRWEVLWGGGVNVMEVCFGNGLKFEGLPDDETKRLVEWHKGERRYVSHIACVNIGANASYLFPFNSIFFQIGRFGTSH